MLSRYLSTALLRQSKRCNSSLPYNFGLVFVPQQESWVVERMGRYHQMLKPGPNFLIPFLDKIKYVQNLREIAIEIPQQTAITSDNVNLNLDGALYLRVIDPYMASYGVEDPEYAITMLAQTTMRAEIGKIILDVVFMEREKLNNAIVEAINKASKDTWGIVCLRYEIKDVKMPPRIQEAMQKQVEAERTKRALILESEGKRQYEINVAEGEKMGTILRSEANKQMRINQAIGEAKALATISKGQAFRLKKISSVLTRSQQIKAASLGVAEKYVEAFGNLAKTGNTLILPADTGNISNAVTQALSIGAKIIGDKQVSHKKRRKTSAFSKKRRLTL